MKREQVATFLAGAIAGAAVLALLNAGLAEAQLGRGDGPSWALGVKTSGQGNIAWRLHTETGHLEACGLGVDPKCIAMPEPSAR